MKPLLTVTLALGALAAQAQDFGPPPDAPMRGDIEWSLGLGLLHGPAYLGADQTKTRALPLISVRWREGWFAGVTGAGYAFKANPDLTLGLRLGLDRGRDEDDAAALRGMGDIPLRPELGGFVSYRLVGPVSVGASLRYGSGADRKGLLGDVGLRAALPLGGAHRLTANLSTTWANQAAQQSQFGVTAAQSLASGYALTTPGAGLRDLNLGLGYGYALSAQSQLMLGLSHRLLLGDAKDSPLTRRDSGSSLSLMLMYRL